jgi:ABC-type amino acid transport substrate-binding protein
MYKIIMRIALVAFITVVFLGCVTTQDTKTVMETKQNTLRVGITPTYPPLIFKLGDKIAGVEVDLARKLGEELNRPVEFVEFRWD